MRAYTEVRDRVGESALTLLQAPQPPPIETVLTALLNDLGATAGDIVLVLDDYHVIDASDVQDGMAFLLDHLPPWLHVVIASRADPALPLARWRARGELAEIRAADLRFTPDEAAAYLTEMMGLQLTARDVAALEARTEGWIAALQLAALSMQGRDDVAAFIAGFAGDDRYVVDYLVEEVLQRQPDGVQAFLLQTSILGRLSGPLCDAITGQGGGKAMLAALDRGNLFLVPLDDRRRWYRYHHLFADVLQARLLDERPGHRDWILSSGSHTGVLVGGFLEVIVALAGIGTAVTLYPVVKRQNEGIALGFVAARVLEAGLIFTGVVSLLSLVTLRQDLGGAAGANAAALVTTGASHVAVYNWTFLLSQSLMPGINALLLGSLLYRSRLVPRVIPVMGLIGGPLLIVAVFATLFGQHSRPGGPAVAVLPVTELGSPTWVPVVQSQASWDRILLPTRPNRSTGWIYLGGGGLQTAYPPYQVDINLAAYRLTILDAGHSLGTWTVAEGAPARAPRPGGPSCSPRWYHCSRPTAR